MPSIFLEPQVFDFHPYKVGSLPDHVNTIIRGMIAGKSATPTTQRPYATNNFNASDPVVTRNPDCFLGNFDYAAVSQQNGNNQNFGCTLISSRHVIMCAHAPSSSPVVFMKSDGALVSRSILATAELLPGNLGDTTIGILSSQITDITPAKILPSNYWQHLAGIGCLEPPPSSILDSTVHNLLYTIIRAGHRPDDVEEPSFNVAKLAMITANEPTAIYASISNGPGGRDQAWQGSIAGGDSGSPVFIPVNGALVLIGKMAFASGSMGFMLTGQIKSDIEAVMTSLAVAQGDFTSYTLSEVDLTGFVL